MLAEFVVPRGGSRESGSEQIEPRARWCPGLPGHVTGDPGIDAS